MKRRTLGPWLVVLAGALYFLLPLLGTFEFSLRYRRGVYSFEAYRIVLSDPRFHAAFLYSTALAVATIVVGILLVVPTAYWIQLRLPSCAPWWSSSRSCRWSSRRSCWCSATSGSTTARRSCR